MSVAYLKEKIDLGECISSLDFSPSGEYVACGLIDETIEVWKADFSQEVSKQKVCKLEGSVMGVVDVKFNPIGNILAVSSLDSVIRVWNVDETEKICEIQCQPLENWKLTFKDQNTLLTAGEQGRVQEYNINSKQLISSTPTRDIFATAIASSNDKKRGVAVGNNDGTLFIIDYNNNKHESSQNYHHKMIRSISFSNNDTQLITASDDSTAKLIDLEKQEVIATFSGHSGSVNCVDYCRIDSKLFVTSSYDSTIKVWDISKKSCIDTIKFHQDNVWAAKFHPSKKIIGSVSDDGVIAFHELR